MKRILAAIFLIYSVSFSFAQSPVITQPYAVTTFNASGIITPTSLTFQSIWAANTTTRGRAACKIQNNGTHTEYVFFGPIANATTQSSLSLAAGVITDCNIGGTVIQDQVSITGTAGDPFYADQR